MEKSSFELRVVVELYLLWMWQGWRSEKLQSNRKPIRLAN